MRRLLVRPCGLLVLASLVLTLAQAPGQAEPPKPLKIFFPTFDKVDINGTFYPSSADGPKSPCVLFLHKLGGNRDGWEALALALQEKGFAVLAFDFRGHGESRKVGQEFWNNRNNVNGMLPKTPKKDSIDFKSFQPTYYPMLVNDIAAAKVYLERRNNAKECNANELMIVGAEEGASLGLIWLATEWSRRKRGYNQKGMLDYYPDPEGIRFSAFVSLSIRPTLAPKVPVPLAALFKNAKIADTPMCFFVGKDDRPGLTCTNQIYDQYLKADKNKLEYTYRIKPFEGVSLAGHEDLVVKYLSEKIKDARPVRIWSEHDVPVEGRPSLNPMMQIPLNQFGIILP